MARIRSIKPDFWSSEDVVSVSRNARLLFIGLWTFADDCGNGSAKAKELKMKVFPGDSDVTPAKIEKWLNELNQELITIYNFEDKQYYHVMGWEHQLINNPSKAKYPAFSEDYRRTTVGLDPLKEGIGRIGGKGDAGTDIPAYLTYKQRKLTGFWFEAFNEFWKLWRHPRYGTDKSRAADSWMDMPWPEGNKDTFDNRVYKEKILYGARKSTEERDTIIEQGDTPKYAQGWLSERRYETYADTINEKKLRAFVEKQLERVEAPDDPKEEKQGD